MQIILKNIKEVHIKKWISHRAKRNKIHGSAQLGMKHTTHRELYTILLILSPKLQYLASKIHGRIK